MKKLNLNKIRISKLNQIKGGIDTANADAADTVAYQTRNCDYNQTRDRNDDDCKAQTNNNVKTGDIRYSQDCIGMD